jgi:hypothetical protein
MLWVVFVLCISCFLCSILLCSMSSIIFSSGSVGDEDAALSFLFDDSLLPFILFTDR